MEEGVRPQQSGSRAGLLTGVPIAIGSAALVAAMLVDFASVLGRHIGFRVTGAIEIVQVCVTAAIASALVIATLRGAHAAVHLVTSRLPKGAQIVVGRISDLLTAAVFIALLTGDAWLTLDVWSQNEKSDLLGLPIVPARLVWCAGLALTALISFVAVFRKAPQPEEELPGEL